MEEWRAVPGHEDRYLVSNEGRVARLMTVKPPTKRYVRINVRDAANKMRTYLAHVWVLEAFVGPRPEGALARHLNDDPTDNRVENLAWGSVADNTSDAYRNGGRQLKQTCRLGHPIEGANLQAKGRRCKACNRARAQAHYRNEPFSKEMADRHFEEVMGINLFGDALRDTLDPKLRNR